MVMLRFPGITAWKKKGIWGIPLAIFFIGSLFFLLIILCPLSPIWFLQPLKPNCFPVNYPDGEIVKALNGKIYSYEIQEPIRSVSQFFKQKLEETENKNRLWSQANKGKGNILYECYSAANAYEAERGCVYLKDNGYSTLVTSVWSHFPDSAPPCDYFIEDLKTK